MPTEIEVTIESLKGDDGALGYHGMMAHSPPVAHDFGIDAKRRALTYRVNFLGRGGPKIDYTGALAQFISITSSQDIERFAQRYGPLNLCHHGLPIDHTSTIDGRLFPAAEQFDLAQKCTYAIEDGSIGEFQAKSNQSRVLEWLDIWHSLVSQFRSILELIDESRKMKSKGSLKQWEAAFPRWVAAGGIDSFFELEDGPRILRMLLSSEITGWIDASGVRLTYLDYPPEEDSLEWNTSTLGALSMQLLGVARGSQNFAICDFCQNWYEPKRRPSAGNVKCCQRKKCQQKSVNARKRKSLGGD